MSVFLVKILFSYFRMTTVMGKEYLSEIVKRVKSHRKPTDRGADTLWKNNDHI